MEGVCNLIERTSAVQTAQCSERLDHQTRSIQGEIHDSRYICSRGWPCLTAMGGEALVLWRFDTLGQERGWSTLIEAKVREESEGVG